MKDLFLDLEKFKLGYYALEDTTKAPFGSMRIMKNCQITDRGGIAPRPGTSILGTYASSDYTIKGFYNFRKSFPKLFLTGLLTVAMTLIITSRFFIQNLNLYGNLLGNHLLPDGQEVTYMNDKITSTNKINYLLDKN